ncbi:MAG: glycosyltransferase family 2 protein [Pseudomonadota bacterium]
MTTFTIIIPTHNHADTLRYSVQSVLWQTRQDFELFIIGDGVPDRTRQIVAELMAEDARIRFFDFPKGQRHGEAHRHQALQEAIGRFVCYQCDDDLWMPDHLETMAEMLEQTDIAHCMQMEVGIDGRVVSSMFDVAIDPDGIQKMQTSQAGFGLASGGHRMDMYRRLPQGWNPAPVGINTDLHFWLQILAQPGCRYASYKWPNVIHLSSVPRKDWSVEQRVAELAHWWGKIQTESARSKLVKLCLMPIHNQLFRAYHQPVPSLSAPVAAARVLPATPSQTKPLTPYQWQTRLPGQTPSYGWEYARGKVQLGATQALVY